MKINRLVLSTILIAILVSLVIVERYTADKRVDESKYLSPKVTGSPLNNRFGPGGDFRKRYGDKISRIFNEMRASGQAIYVDEIVPEYGADKLNGTEDFKAALKLIENAKKGSPIFELKSLWKKRSELSEEDLDKISELLDDGSVTELLDLAYKASEKDYLDFDLDYSQGPSLLLPHLGSSRDLMKILSLKSYADANNGRSEEAVESLNAALRLNNLANDDVTLIGELVEIASTKILSNNLSELRASGVDLSESYKLLAEDLDTAQDTQLNTIEGERHFFGSWFYEKLINSPDELKSEDMKALFGDDVEKITPAEAKEHYAKYLKAMMNIRELMEEPYYVNSEKLKGLLKSSQNEYLMKQLLPSYDSIYKKFHESQSLLKKNLLAMKVGEYERQHGVKPESLKDLNVPADYLIDNITGKPFLILNTTGGDEIISHIDDESGGLKL